MELKIITIISPSGDTNSELWVTDNQVSLSILVNSEQTLLLKLKGELNTEDQEFIKNTLTASISLEDVPLNLKRILVSTMLMTLVNKVV